VHPRVDHTRVGCTGGHTRREMHSTIHAAHVWRRQGSTHIRWGWKTPGGGGQRTGSSSRVVSSKVCERCHMGGGSHVHVSVDEGELGPLEMGLRDLDECSCDRSSKFPQSFNRGTSLRSTKHTHLHDGHDVTQPIRDGVRAFPTNQRRRARRCAPTTLRFQIPSRRLNVGRRCASCGITPTHHRTRTPHSPPTDLPTPRRATRGAWTQYIHAFVRTSTLSLPSGKPRFADATDA